MGYLEKVLWIKDIKEYQNLYEDRELLADKPWLVLTKDRILGRELFCQGIPVLGILEKEGDSFDTVPYLCEESFLTEKESEAYLERVYRRYKKLPWDILETEHLVVRETTEEDVADFYRIYADKDMVKYTEDLFEDPEAELEYTRQYRDNMYTIYGFGIWTVLEKATGSVIGRAGITTREEFEEVELGFVIGKKWQRKGYAFEVCKGILAYAKEELEFDRVQAFVMPENVASVGLCEKLGMVAKEERALQGTRYLRYEILF